MTPKWIRISDKRTGHQYTIDERAFNSDLHKKLNSSAVDRNGNPRAPKHKVSLGNKAPTEMTTEPTVGSEGDN